MADMILPRPQDAIHKAWLYRVLRGIADDTYLAGTIFFKGGTCAAMLGYLDRFSIDLDFDFVGERATIAEVRSRLEALFHTLGLTIHDQSRLVPQYLLKYVTSAHLRNTIKVDVHVEPPPANVYESRRFSAIDRIIACQTIETMMANKLVALEDRYRHNNAIAGRDVYDIHHFFLQGYRYNEAVIYARTKKKSTHFFTDLMAFIETNISDTIIDEDLNHLLSADQFQRIRKVLKQETLMFLRDEQDRMG
jgi:predicted nucleotidyltransferase component of viral defense system